MSFRNFSFYKVLIKTLLTIRLKPVEHVNGVYEIETLFKIVLLKKRIYRFLKIQYNRRHYAVR